MKLCNITVASFASPMYPSCHSWLSWRLRRWAHQQVSAGRSVHCGCIGTIDDPAMDLVPSIAHLAKGMGVPSCHGSAPATLANELWPRPWRAP